jgi:hypothetical protein
MKNAELNKLINIEEDVLSLNLLVLNDNELEMLLRAVSMMKDFRMKDMEQWKNLYLKICGQVE